MHRFKTLVEQHKDRVYTFAYYFLGNAADAEDVTQDVLIRLWEHHTALDAERLTGWLMRVTRNACIDAYRRRQTYQAAVRVDTEGVAYQQAATLMASPDAAVEANEFQRHLQAALSELQEPHRSIVILREVQDLKYEQISELLGLPLNTVKVYLHRGRCALRKALRTRIDYELS